MSSTEPVPGVAEDSSPMPPAARAGVDEAAGLGRSVVIGSVVGVVLSFVGVLLGMGLAGFGWGPGVGLGLFVAFWGGLGFGVMVGGVTYMSAHEDH